MFSYNFIYILYVYKNYSYIHFTYCFYCTLKINLLKPGTILDHFIKPDLIKYLFLYDISVFILIKCVYFDILNTYHCKIYVKVILTLNPCIKV